MTVPKLISAGIGVAALLAFAGIAGAQNKQDKSAPFGDKPSIDYAERLWAAMKQARLIGDGRWISTPHKTDPPHGAWVSVIDGFVSVADARHRLIVKYNYGGDDLTEASVRANPDRHLVSVTVMLRREDGYDAANKNWYWAKYLPDGSLDRNEKGMALAGRVAKGANAGCIACHKSAPGDDYIFLNDRAERTAK